VAQLTGDNAEVRERLSANASELQQRLEEATGRYERLAEHRAAVVVRVGVLKKKIASLEREVSVLTLERDLSVRDRDVEREAADCFRRESEGEVVELFSRLEEMAGAVKEAQEKARVALESLTAAEKEGAEVRGGLESQILSLVAEQDASRASLEAVVERRDAAQREAEQKHAWLQTQLEVVVRERDDARREKELLLEEVAAVRSALTRERDDAEARCKELSAEVVRCTSDSEAAKAELTKASEKASALMSRLTTMYGPPSSVLGAATPAAEERRRSTLCDEDVDGGGALVPASSCAVSLESNAVLLAEVRHKLHEREEALRLLAEGVKLRERARPLERVLVERMADEHHVSSSSSAGGGVGNTQVDSVGAAASYHRVADIEAREAELKARAAQLKEKEHQLLRVAHELQAKSRALQALHVRVVTAAESKEEEAEARGASLTGGATRTDAAAVVALPAQLPPAPVTPLRAVMPKQDDVVVDGVADVAALNAASPPPRPPNTAVSATSAKSAAAMQLSRTPTREVVEEETQERLAAATAAYRDVLFEHILESTGLQECRSLTKYLQAPHSISSKNDGQSHQHNISGGGGGGAAGLSDMARRTRAMLRALEERLDGSRVPLRGVDPAVQQRSLEAFRRLEKAVRALCGAGL
jgi:hypothetical protein